MFTRIALHTFLFSSMAPYLMCLPPHLHPPPNIMMRHWFSDSKVTLKEIMVFRVASHFLYEIWVAEKKFENC